MKIPDRKERNKERQQQKRERERERERAGERMTPPLRIQSLSLRILKKQMIDKRDQIEKGDVQVLRKPPGLVVLLPSNVAPPGNLVYKHHPTLLHLLTEVFQKMSG